MNNSVSPKLNQKAKARNLTVAIEKMVEEFEVKDSPSPKIQKKMTRDLKKIQKLTGKTKEQDFRNLDFQLNLNYKKRNDKILLYVHDKYNDALMKDENRLLEILQNRPLTSFYKPSQKFLFGSMNEFEEVIKKNKRKFGEVWSSPKHNRRPTVSRTFPLSTSPNTSRSVKLSQLIKKLLVKNLGYRFKPTEENLKSGSKFQNLKQRKDSKGKQSDLKRFDVFDDEEYLSSEYVNYISDVENKLKVQRYIGLCNNKKRKSIQLQVKLSKL